MDPRERRRELAARGKPLKRRSVARAARPATSVAILASSSLRSSGWLRSHSITSSSASRYSASLLSETGTTT